MKPMAADPKKRASFKATNPIPAAMRTCWMSLVAWAMMSPVRIRSK